MFVYKFDHAKDSVFEDGKLPFLARISLSQDDYQWASPTDVHNDKLEIAYIEKGIAYYTIDMNTAIARAGEIVIIHPGSLHAVTSSTSDPTRIWVLHAKDFKIKGLEANQLLRNRNSIILSMRDHQEFVESLLYEIRFLYQKRGTYASGIVSFSLCMLIALLYDMQDDAELIINHSCNPFIQKLMLYLNENYMRKLTLQDIADYFHISTSHLSHEFTKYFSISPINYLINRRLCEAKWKLISSNDSIEEIAFSLGYDNVNHFKNTFMKRTGCTPAKYRELYFDQN
jgi:AraC-type DNA-binding domain-containing proteins